MACCIADPLFPLSLSALQGMLHIGPIGTVDTVRSIFMASPLVWVLRLEVVSSVGPQTGRGQFCGVGPQTMHGPGQCLIAGP